MIRKITLGATTAIGLAAAATGVFAENVRLAYIDPLSGPFAGIGTNGLDNFEYAADVLVNETGGVLGGEEFEIVSFDSKLSPKEALIQLQIAIDSGIRIILSGNSSGVASALTEAINKHNRRNPESRVLFLNYSTQDPALTNDKCNFWHFRFDANSDMKMDALTDIIAQNEEIKSVYLIGQDYSFGKAVAAAAVSNLDEKRPELEIVGNELHPIGKVKDFTPYSRKIIASGADAVITGNWGADMLGLGKSILENGFEGPIYTYFALADGITAAFGDTGKGYLRLIGEGTLNPPVSDRASAYAAGFKAKYPNSDLSQPRIANVVEMLARAINDAGTATDVVAIANALEGMEHESIWGGTLYMRPEDHQIIQDVHVFAHTDEGVVVDFDNSGFGLVREATVEMASMNSATSCDMKRP